jgi:CMP-N-acetylneuraminic acid synthetase
MKVVAMIPARAGSKRVPGKNIKPLLGKPLLGYTVEAATNCSQIESVYVNSDSEHYLEIGSQFGANTYFRPPRLATDNSNIKEVVEDFLLFLSNQGEHYDEIIVLFPVYPIRTSKHLTNIIECYFAEGSQRPLTGLKAVKEHPYLCYKRDEKGYIKSIMDIDENIYYRHQQYPKYYLSTLWACIVPTKSVAYLNANMRCSDSYGYIIPERVPFVNIDTSLDFEFAEFLMQKVKSGKIKIDD